VQHLGVLADRLLERGQARLRLAGVALRARRRVLLVRPRTLVGGAQRRDRPLHGLLLGGRLGGLLQRVAERVRVLEQPVARVLLAHLGLG